MGTGSTPKKQSASLSLIDIILVLIILALFAIVIGLVVVTTSDDSDRAIVVVASPTASPTSPATVTPTATPTFTHTPTRTPTHTHTPTNTPTNTPTYTPTSPPPPLVNLALTVTPVSTLEPQQLPAGYIPPGQAAPLREFSDNAINIILMGSDVRPDRSGWRTDVMILVSVDPDVPSVTMLSIPRDMWVYIPNWKWTRVNLADSYGDRNFFPGGGPGLVKQTIQYNLGIPVQYYARVNFAGFRNLIDSVGGVDVVADCELYDIFPDVPDDQTDILVGEALANVITGTIDIPTAGVYHLDGKHALWYSRSRKTTSDFDRSRRQHRVLRGLWASIQRQGIIGQLPALWDSLTQTVETDLTLNEVIFLAQLATQLDATRIRSRFIDNTMLHFFVSASGANVYAYSYDELEPVLDEAYAELATNIASQAGALVEVWNGTTNANWDRVGADRLAWAGFEVWANGIADRIYERTIIIDYSTTSKGSRLSQLARLFRVSSADIIYQPDANSPIAHRVILGNNFQTCLRSAPVSVATATPTATPSP